MSTITDVAKQVKVTCYNGGLEIRHSSLNKYNRGSMNQFQFVVKIPDLPNRTYQCTYKIETTCDL